MKKTIISGVAITVISAVLLAAGAYLWDHFRDTDGIREDLDQLYGYVDDVAQDE